ncbi:hypothetical protein BB560_003667 [Smittium megazygosporum]|uniref:Uncharacterized protein n=1 Tax=Smittium megazygosporum TaxID=133381 RepID=A0A2T9ZBB6_9FUNG|nr:hypothetical protein BB560_003667 [Smittium megazygosporum]
MTQTLQEFEYIIYKHIDKNLDLFFENDSDIAREYLRDFVVKGRFQELNKDITNKDFCLASIILHDQEKLDVPDDIFFTSLPGYFYLFVSILGFTITNFLIDVSLNPHVLKKLELEQKKIMAKYGKKLTVRRLDEMVYLDAALSETLRLGTNSSKHLMIYIGLFSTGLSIQP